MTDGISNQRPACRAAEPLPKAMVWGGHASRPLVTAVLLIHVAALIWLCGDRVRLRLLGYDFREVSSEAVINDPPGAIPSLDYTEDDPSDLQQFRVLAEPVVAGSSDDAEKLRRLGDYIYSLRRDGAPDIRYEGRLSLSATLARLQRGEHGSCGEMSPVLAAFWRSMGGHTRAVRWATVQGDIGHVAVELYSATYHRWMYYDMNLNGYGEDDDRIPLSIASLRSNLLTGEDVHLVTNARAQDWTPGEFTHALRDFPVEWYALNNRALYYESDRRFGAFNRLSWILSRLPSPIDRVLDNVLGDRDRRLVVDGRIQIAGLLTFSGARLWLLYFCGVIGVCATTLLGGRLKYAVRPPHVETLDALSLQFAQRLENIEKPSPLAG